jgi:nitric oxide reductase subunit B
MTRRFDPVKWFLVSALLMLVAGLVAGLLAAITYISPGGLLGLKNFSALRPLHVSSVIFWILMGATGAVYYGIQVVGRRRVPPAMAFIHWLLWVAAIAGVIVSYAGGKFGGREYWEFPPALALLIAAAWLIFMINFFRIALAVKGWPVYMWMWMTGIVFFMFTFAENYLWTIPYFRQHFVSDMTVQWKVNGSMVGAWNQMLYGTAFFLMDRISGEQGNRSRMAFFMYFLGLFNLMFNWGHHIYTLPGAAYVRYLGYAVSMTEWIIFIRIVWLWRAQVNTARSNFHYFPYRFLMAADGWVFINLGQALLMSIPALNLITHGTHVTVAHAMGATIGINSMILLAACFECLRGKCGEEIAPAIVLRRVYVTAQASLLVFWAALNGAGISRGLWQLSAQQAPFSEMMKSLHPWFVVVFAAGIALALSLSFFAFVLVRHVIRCAARERNTAFTKYILPTP